MINYILYWYITGYKDQLLFNFLTLLFFHFVSEFEQFPEQEAGFRHSYLILDVYGQKDLVHVVTGALAAIQMTKYWEEILVACQVNLCHGGSLQPARLFEMSAQGQQIWYINQTICFSQQQLGSNSISCRISCFSCIKFHSEPFHFVQGINSLDFSLWFGSALTFQRYCVILTFPLKIS